MQDLTEIGNQNRWANAMFKELNMAVLEGCMSRLSTAVERFMVCFWSSGLECLTVIFFQLANDLHDTRLLQELLARLNKMSRKSDDVHKDVKHIFIKVEDIHNVLFKAERLGMMPARQEMPMKPEIFHGRDDLVNDIAQLLRQGGTSRVCILGPGGMGKTSVSLAVVELPVIKERFPGGNVIWVPCIEATSATLLLEILYVGGGLEPPLKDLEGNTGGDVQRWGKREKR